MSNFEPISYHKSSLNEKDFLLRFLQTRHLESSKAAFTIAFFTAVNHNLITNNESLNTETHKTDRNPLITDNKPWPSSVTFYFLEDPLKGLTAAKKHERQLAFEFQRLGVFEKCSKWKQTNSTYFRIENWITFTKTKTSVLFVSNNSVIITCQNSWGNNKPIKILTGEQEFWMYSVQS